MQYLRLLIFVLLYMALPLQADIEYIQVETAGRGTTLLEAVNRALAEAIGRVQGKSIDSDTQLITTEESVDTSDDSSYLASEKYISKVREKTKGAVSKYNILSSDKDDKGVWEVRLSAFVAKYKKAASANRKRIAVLPATMARDTYKISGSHVEAEDIRRRFNEALVADLVQTRRFTILDRQYLEATESELSLAASGEVPVEEQARLGQKLVADYVLTGSIEDLSYETSSRKTRMTGRTITNANGYVEISYRLIDVALQQVAFSDALRIPIKDEELDAVAGSGGVTQAITSSMLDTAAGKIAKAITDQIYPMALISVKGSRVVIGQGGKGVKPGTRYKVYQRGDRLYDPYTKEYIGRNEVFCCTVEIDRVVPKTSYAHIVENGVDLESGFVPGTYILREKIKTTRISRNGESAGKKRVATKKKASDEDW